VRKRRYKAKSKSGNEYLTYNKNKERYLDWSHPV
jgi:hypothetical protein